MKIRLEIIELRVETFATTGEESRARGTVRGHEGTLPGVQCATHDPTCPESCGVDTCGLSCYGTCHPALQTCADTCPCGEG